MITGLPSDCCYLHGIKTCDVVVVHAADVCVGARIGACRHLGFGGHVGVAVTRHWSFFGIVVMRFHRFVSYTRLNFNF